MAACAAPPCVRISCSTPSPTALRRPRRRRVASARCSLAAAPGLRAPPELVDSILSKVKGTDRGVLLPEEGHQEVADVAQQLGKYCIDEPVKSPLIFGGESCPLYPQPNRSSILSGSIVVWLCHLLTDMPNLATIKHVRPASGIGTAAFLGLQCSVNLVQLMLDAILIQFLCCGALDQTGTWCIARCRHPPEGFTAPLSDGWCSRPTTWFRWWKPPTSSGTRSPSPSLASMARCL
uniref:Uncharacterized protein n=1 Tax=Aegilops tauschii subsp. strangulata TaxID=200361 RepID=A0A453CT53_AEGTS